MFSSVSVEKFFWGVSKNLCVSVSECVCVCVCVSRLTVNLSVSLYEKTKTDKQTKK